MLAVIQYQFPQMSYYRLAGERHFGFYFILPIFRNNWIQLSKHVYYWVQDSASKDWIYLLWTKTLKHQMFRQLYMVFINGWVITQVTWPKLEEEDGLLVASAASSRKSRLLAVDRLLLRCSSSVSLSKTQFWHRQYHKNYWTDLLFFFSMRDHFE